jgi:hypothetical protein
MINGSGSNHYIMNVWPLTLAVLAVVISLLVNTLASPSYSTQVAISLQKARPSLCAMLQRH